MKAQKAALTALFAVICGAAPVSAQPTIAAAEARKIVLSSRAAIWRDPYSIRDVRISEPHACPTHALVSRSGHGAGITCICIEANAKNAMGGYTGLTKTRLLLENHKVLDAQGPLGTAMPDHCGPFRPFPELGK